MTAAGAWQPVPFRASVTARLKAAARSRSRPYAELQQEYLLQRFLARVFHDSDTPWVLKGGTGLLARLPGARHSQDLDLLRTGGTPAEATADLQDIAEVDVGDPIRFVVGDARMMTGGVVGARVLVRAYLGATEFGSFPIDLSTGLTLVAEVDRQRVDPIIDVDRIGPLPEFVLYPLADQIADKVCAMYERHGPQNQASTRFRHLVDLVLIATNFTVGAGATRAALAQEAARRGLQLPAAIASPDPIWAAGYAKTATATLLPADLRDVDSALALVGGWLDRLLAPAEDGAAGAVPDIDEWDPVGRNWSAPR